MGKERELTMNFTHESSFLNCLQNHNLCCSLWFTPLGHIVENPMLQNFLGD